MEQEEGKQSPKRTPYSQLEQVSSDFIQAIGLQEQDETFITTTLESETESSDDHDFDNDDGDGDEGDFFLSQEFESDLQFLESEGSSSYDEEMEEFYIDVDELTYEELIELGEFIGKEKRGLSENEICSCLKFYKFVSVESNGGIDRCVICQNEYEEGQSDGLVALHCGHPYHTDCITKWLQIKRVCPICSTEILVPKMG